MSAPPAVPHVWVLTDDEGWQALPIKTANPDGSVAVAWRGKITTFPAEKTCKHSQSHNENHEDVMSMDYVEEAPLLGLLRRRFNEDSIYTFASNMLLSINPYKPIPGLLDTMELNVSDGVVVKMPTPHVYTVASRSYADMLRTQRGQSVLMSGESGAGKTEASKLVVRYLVSSPTVLSRCKTSMGYGGKGAQFSSQLEESVVRSVPLLEAFGNAQTVNNVNSSRFGKLLTLHYSSEGAVLGAATTTFLLEKSRLVQHSPGERNFHVFYRLVKDANESLRRRLKLTATPSDYAYLTAVEDGGKGRVASMLDADAGTGGLPALLGQLASIGISDEDVAAVWDIVAGILHLGNIEFVTQGSAASGPMGGSALRRPSTIVKSAGGEAQIKADARTTAALQAVSELWSIPLPLLTLALTERTMSAGKRKSVSSIPLTPQQALDARNGLAKAVYERLFTWLVGKVNVASHAPDPATLPPPPATGSYFANAATAAAAAAKLFEAQAPKPPKPPKEKPAPPEAAPMPVRGPPKVTEIYTKLTGAKAVSFVPREAIGLRPKFIVPQQDEYDVSSDEELEDDVVPPPLAPSSPFVAILDIFGFEVLQNNGFEQLCINFANEALQQFFIQSVFVTETREYMKQGLSGWQSVPFKDNQDNIDIILRRPVGLLSLLDQQVVLGERGSDAGWVSAVKREMFGKVSGIRDDAIPSSDTFVVKHFAADVVYKAENFVARNNDALHHDLAQLPKASGSALLLALFAKDNEVSAPSTPSVDDAVSAASSPHGFGPKMPQLTSQGSSGGLSSPSTAGGTPSGPSDTGIVRGGQHKLATLDTVSSRFTQQLDAMMSELAATSPQFIRCVKSNARQVPNEFDSTLVLHQLRYLGVLDAIRVRKVGYPVRREFEELVRDYIELTGNKTAARRRLKAKKGPKVIAADICQKVLGDEGVSGWQRGRDKMFLRNGILEVLDAALKRRLADAAIIVQAVAKGFVQRKRFVLLKKAALRLQSIVRMLLAMRRKWKLRRFRSATAIRAVFVGYVAKKKYTASKRSAVRVQAFSRGLLVRLPIQRARAKRRNDAAIQIQSLVRQVKLHRLFIRMKAVIVKLQCWAKAVLARRRYRRYKRAVTKLQACFRRIAVHRRHTSIIEGRRKWRHVLEPREAVVLQSLIRKRRDKGGMFKQDRRRQLILTTKPRLLYLDPETTPPTVKGQILFDENFSVEQVSALDFDFTHSEIGEDGSRTRRVMHLTDLMGSATRWIKAIQECLGPGITVDFLYHGDQADRFEMQGVLMKKNRTSKGWNRRFFVLHNETLMYFSKASDESGKDKYDIKHNTRVLDCDGPPAFSFKVETPGDVERGPIMAAENAHEMEAWKSAFAQVIASLRRKRSTEIGMHGAAGGPRA